MMTIEQLENRLREHFSEGEIKAYDLTGGGDHWKVRIVSQDFADKTLIEQHKMVYQALGDWMHKEIHALAIETELPHQ